MHSVDVMAITEPLKSEEDPPSEKKDTRTIAALVYGAFSMGISILCIRLGAFVFRMGLIHPLPYPPNFIVINRHIILFLCVFFGAAICIVFGAAGLSLISKVKQGSDNYSKPITRTGKIFSILGIVFSILMIPLILLHEYFVFIMT